MASHFLLGNIFLDGVTSLYNKAYSIDPTAFLPQRDQAAIASERARDLSTRIEDNLDMLERIVRRQRPQSLASAH